MAAEAFMMFAAGSQILGALGSYRAGQAQEQAYRQQAEIMEGQAQVRERANQEELRRGARQGSGLLGQQRAEAAASGFDVSSKSFTDIHATTYQSVLESLAWQQMTGQSEVMSMRNEAKLRRFAGQRARDSATWGALGQLGNAAFTYYWMRSRRPPPEEGDES